MSVCLFTFSFAIFWTYIDKNTMSVRARTCSAYNHTARSSKSDATILGWSKPPKKYKTKDFATVACTHTHRYLVINPVMLDDKSFWNHRELQSLCKRYVTVQFVDAYCPIYKFQHDLGSYSTDHSHMLQNMFVFAGFHYLLVQTKEKVS